MALSFHRAEMIQLKETKPAIENESEPKKERTRRGTGENTTVNDDSVDKH